MVAYLGSRPHRYTILLIRGTAFVQRFEVDGDPLPDGHDLL